MIQYNGEYYLFEKEVGNEKVKGKIYFMEKLDKPIIINPETLVPHHPKYPVKTQCRIIIRDDGKFYELCKVVESN